MHRIIAQATKELIQLRRDRLTLILALVLPLSTLAILGISISLDVDDLPIIVQDFDQTNSSRKYIERLQQSLTFQLISLSLTEDPIRILEQQRARAVVIIPAHFDRDLSKGNQVEIQTLIDATDANTANIIRGAINLITQSASSELRAVKPSRSIKAELRYWYNPGRQSARYFGPAVFAVVLALFPPLLPAISLSREIEQQSMTHFYISGITTMEFLLGKIAAFLLVALVQWLLTLLLTLWQFSLWFAGDPTPFLIGSFCYLLCNIISGVMIGVAIPNQAAAIQTTQVGGFVLSFLMSGFIFPIANIPVYIRWITHLVPASYFIELSRDALTRGSGWSTAWPALLMLTLLTIIFYSISWVKLHRLKVSI